MKRLLFAVLLSLSCHAPQVFAAPPTRESVIELIRLIDAQQMTDTMLKSLDTMLADTMNKQLKGVQINARQQAILDKFRADVVALMKSEMSWEQLEPIFVEIYQGSMTQQEVDAMLAFYRTPEGQSVLKKLPQVMQMSMNKVQGIMENSMPKMARLQAEAVAELQKAK